MPELPDVEGQRIALARYLPGLRVLDVRVLDAGVLRNTTAEAFREQLLGRRFGSPGRRGKWLILPTDGPSVLIHNGMTGKPYFVDGRSGVQAESHDRLTIATDGGELRYADLRKLRGVWLVDHDADVAAVIGEQGIDALEMSLTQFTDAVRGRRGALKTVLMNQHVLAGLGNMLSDEICWRARLHPARTIATLDDGALATLHRELRRVLRAAIKQGSIPRTRSWLSSTRDQDQAPCPRCRATLRRSRIAGRTSIWCPRCQPATTTSR